jgi:two-component system, OmpR family, sensor histidine kinase MtrB
VDAEDSVPVRQRLVVDGLPVMAVGMPVPAGGTFIELFPLVELTGTLRFLSLVLVAGTALSGPFGVGLGLWASRRALRPLTELTSAASRVARGDLDARLPEQADPIWRRWPRRSTPRPRRCSTACSAMPGSPVTSATSCGRP